ncbi:MAG: Coenzyme F420 hydrogenase/dehydrogenase, beta subunit C-terminal domain [Eubacterium sp.]|nr:Coenzyme F420 hydrogenase/dehydrogenase, beta subunit C-terminal domain [Eubacterium sp.]
MNTIAYAAVNKNDNIRERSSSGAVFYELAERIIKNGGIVYGAKFNENWSVVHGHTDSAEGLYDFLGSKYVQSSMADEYKDAERNLKAGRIVLFSGTPCQIEGLKYYLGKEYEKLLTVDFICHGVPSPFVWKKYLTEAAKGREVTSVSFRDKTEGWIHFSLRIDFKDGSRYRQTQQEDLFMKGFLQDIYLRPSCYQCRFKTIERNSDITLADYWGVNVVLPEMFDDKGTSVILIHSKCGEDIWKDVQSKFQFFQIDIGEVKEKNSNAVSSVFLPKNRADFYGKGAIDFDYLRSLTKTSLKKKIIVKAKNAVKRILKK